MFQVLYILFENLIVMNIFTSFLGNSIHDIENMFLSPRKKASPLSLKALILLYDR